MPILKNVDETIAGIINKKENGFRIPPVKYKRMLNCIKSYKRKNEAYVSLSWFTFILNCKKRLVSKPIKIIKYESLLNQTYVVFKDIVNFINLITNPVNIFNLIV